MPMKFCLMYLQSGYPLQEMNSPKRPCLSTMGRPQFSQYSSCEVSCTSAVSRSGRSMGFSLVKVQLLGSSLSYELHAKNDPCLPHLITSGEPHRSHFSSVGFSIRLMFSMCFCAYLRSRSNLP